MILTTWCGSRVECRGRYFKWFMGWLRFLVRRSFCRHEWIRRADLDYLFDVGRNKLFFWSCPKCGARKARPLF